MPQKFFFAQFLTFISFHVCAHCHSEASAYKVDDRMRRRTEYTHDIFPLSDLLQKAHVPLIQGRTFPGNDVFRLRIQHVCDSFYVLNFLAWKEVNEPSPEGC